MRVALVQELGGIESVELQERPDPTPVAGQAVVKVGARASARGSRDTAVWAGEQGMNLMSSTLLLENTQVPFDQLQAEQIELFGEAWSRAGHTREPRVSVSRSVIPITSDLDRRLFGADANEDQVGWLDGAISRFGRSYTGEPDQIADDLAKDAAVQAADTVLLTVPSQLDVDYNAAMLETIAREIAPALGWTPRNLTDPVR
jgi:alkanesulfonate monooxygenase SsuD/methylene tetrahydromethanopterin reductase-like flavin-dependent oxidoreductase (luciferase family)